MISMRSFVTRLHRKRRERVKPRFGCDEDLRSMKPFLAWQVALIRRR